MNGAFLETLARGFAAIIVVVLFGILLVHGICRITGLGKRRDDN